METEEEGKEYMTTIEIEILEPVLKQAQVLATRENISGEEFITLAATQAIGVWSNESRGALRAKEASQERFLEMLTENLNVDGEEYRTPWTVVAL